MSILEPRLTFLPHQYPIFYKIWGQQLQSFWSPFEINLSKDVVDYNTKLTDSERNVISNTLKGFTQTEVFIEDYWSSKVSKWFPKPEIVNMANLFAAFESIHIVSYSLLEETLGIQDAESFLQEPTVKAKLDRLINYEVKSKEDIARSLAIFSAFSEGVSLFSAFAILLSFSKRDLLPGIASIISYSIRDESCHSESAISLFKILIAENPEIWTDELKKDIYDAARLTVQLEDDFIDKAFELGPIEGLDPKDLKNYIRFRTNTKLGDLGLKMNWKNIDKDSLTRLAWFDVMSSGITQSDFFATRETNYAKDVLDFDGIWEN